MAKTQELTGSDLIPAKVRTKNAARQRGIVPSDELVPMQFRMQPDFVRAFKQEALNRDMKLNELLKTVFESFMKTSK